MSVQRQMGAIDRQVVVEQTAHQLVAFIRPGMRGRPKQPMMDQQQVGFGRHRQPDGGKAGIDGCRNAGDRAAILHLQPVGGAVVILHLAVRSNRSE